MAKTWYKIDNKVFNTGKLFATRAEAEHEKKWTNSTGEIITIETDKYNGFGNAHNWADWHGEP